MTQENVKHLQEALTIIAQVCDAHVATAADHRIIANSLKTITDSMAVLIKENINLSQRVKSLSVVDNKPEPAKVDCGAV